ncbi:uncharacterized protein RHO25_002176 [Cercospora beticola]|uniref:Uncharacterized protein n=1 Tax=Cercospora beticola TaxID=122368 RepID=A0ABZ0NDF5_CERBT|nr:hypothetical protein RHO25_002176 [Cercospora beticola]
MVKKYSTFFATSFTEPSLKRSTFRLQHRQSESAELHAIKASRWWIATQTLNDGSEHFSSNNEVSSTRVYRRIGRFNTAGRLISNVFIDWAVELSLEVDCVPGSPRKTHSDLFRWHFNDRHTISCGTKPDLRELNGLWHHFTTFRRNDTPLGCRLFAGYRRYTEPHLLATPIGINEPTSDYPLAARVDEVLLWRFRGRPAVSHGQRSNAS